MKFKNDKLHDKLMKFIADRPEFIKTFCRRPKPNFRLY